MNSCKNSFTLKQMSLHFKRRLRFYNFFDLYTQQIISVSDRTIEHVLPVSKIPRRAINDPFNLFVISRTINSFRSNYRFGGEIDEIHSCPHQFQEIGKCYRSTGKKIFYPRYGHRIIAQVGCYMLDKYPNLREEDFFEDGVLDQWNKRNFTPIERWIYDLHVDLLLRR